MKNNLTEIQQTLLDELKWFDAFCRKHNLRYYAIGGTLLGAMRHSGFIPWDDDIDVGMPRADYERLKKFTGAIDERYCFETYDSTSEDYCYPINKLYDKTTTLIEHKRVNVVRGVFIDIFPLDGVGNDINNVDTFCSRILKTYQLYISMVGDLRHGRSFAKNMAVFIAKLIPRFIIRQRNIRIKLNRMCAEYDFDSSQYGGNLLGAYGKREIIETAIFGTPAGYPFEDMTIMGPEKADEYLAHIYKDWRKLPPKEKQVTHHDFVMCDINTPYK